MSTGSEKQTPTIVDAVRCEPCGKILLAGDYHAHKMGHETENENDKAAGVQSRYLEAQQEVLSALTSAVEMCSRASGPNYVRLEAAQWRKLLTRIKEG